MTTGVPNPLAKIGQLNPPTRLLCGPGPGNAHPRVHSAMALPQVGHMDPGFIQVVEDVKALLRYAWQTNNAFTIPISGTGSAAWEAAVANITNPGDVHLTFVNGYFGERHCDMASRFNAVVKKVDKEWGGVFSFDEIKAAIAEHKPQVVWICAAETSTGARQPLEGVGALCREHNCLLLVDSVTAIGGVPLDIDALQIDVAYAGGQKCLSCPPGLSPLTLGPRALAKIQERAKQGKKSPTWYFDMEMLAKYVNPPEQSGPPRTYHHTPPISMMYALREALTVLAEEGLQESWARHAATASYFCKLITDAGLQMYISDPSNRLPNLHAIVVPQGIDAGAVARDLRDNYYIEVGAGLGPLAGKIFRVGLMGYNSRKDVALTVATALIESLKAHGWSKSA